MLSVVVVSYNTREMTSQCLRELLIDLGDTAAEVFVVDNGSHDGSVAAIRGAFPEVRLIETGRNAGFAAANNLAIARAAGEFVLLLNSDAFVRPGSISALLGYLQTHPSAAAVGPRLLNADGSLQLSCYKFPGPARAFCEHTLLTAAFPNHWLIGDYRRWPHDAERDVDFVIGACMLVRRSAIQQVGMLDEQFFMYFEETDWCKRFHAAGLSVGFTPGAVVTHLNGGSGKEQPDRVFNESRRSGERYIIKHHGRAGLAVVHTLTVAGALLRISVFGLLAAVPGRREPARALRRQWKRILLWTLGRRGPGLRPDTLQR